MPMKKALLLATALALPSVAHAHPHVFAEAKLEVSGDDKVFISELRNVWRFDEVFSSSVLMDFDKNSRNYNTLRFIDEDGSTLSVAVSGPIEVNSPQSTLRGALAGLGFAALPDFIARPHIESGALISLFEDRLPQDRGIYAVYPHRRYLPAKVRSLVDFLSNWFRKAQGTGNRT